MTPRAVLVVILLVAFGCLLLLIEGTDSHEPYTYTPLPASEFSLILPSSSAQAHYEPIDWLPPVLVTKQPTPSPTATPKPKPPKAKTHFVGTSIKGTATWYCLPSWPSRCMKVHPNPAGLFAAAGPALRAAIGRNWRNHLVTVRANGRAVVVRLADWCKCPGNHTIDLYSGPFSTLSGRDPSSPGGVLDVKISW